MEIFPYRCWVLDVGLSVGLIVNQLITNQLGIRHLELGTSHSSRFFADLMHNAFHGAGYF